MGLNSKEVLLTYEGLKKLEDELEFLKGEKRVEVAERIKQALSFGDISENSEYDEAKNEQAQLETKIAEIESKLKRAKIIDEEEISTDKVTLGAHVKLLDMEYDDEIEYQIVGSTEADPKQHKISNESPVGEALIGCKVDEVVEINVPDGVIKFKILEIHK